MRTRLEQSIERDTDDVVTRKNESQLSLRSAAHMLALTRICEAARARGGRSYFS